MGVYHKGGSTANGRNPISDISHDYVRKVLSERKQFVFLANVIFFILILTSYRSRISFYQQLKSPLCIRYSKCSISAFDL